MATQDKLNRILQTKEEIKQSIINKGVDVADDDTFATYPAKIDEIEVMTLEDSLRELIEQEDGCFCDNLFNKRKLTQKMLDAILSICKDKPIKSAYYFIPEEVIIDENLTIKAGDMFVINSTNINDSQFNKTFSGLNVTNKEVTIKIDENSPLTIKTINLFYNNTNIEKVNLINFSKSNSLYGICNGCTSLIEITGLDCTNATTLETAFRNCSKLVSLELKNTTKCITFNSTFYGCSELTEIIGLDFSNTQNLNSTFYGCKKLKRFDFTTLTNKCTNITNLFSLCAATEEIINLNITKVTNTTLIFNAVNAINLKKLTFQPDEGNTRTVNMKISFSSHPVLVNGSEESHTNLVEMLNSLPTTTASTSVISLPEPAFETLTEEEIAIANGKGWEVVNSSVASVSLLLDDEDYAEMEMMEMDEAQEGDDVLV